MRYGVKVFILTSKYNQKEIDDWQNEMNSAYDFKIIDTKLSQSDDKITLAITYTY